MSAEPPPICNPVPPLTAEEILNAVPGGPGYEARVTAAVAAALAEAERRIAELERERDEYRRDASIFETAMHAEKARADEAEARATSAEALSAATVERERVLREALEDLLFLQRKPGESIVDHFERHAERFYRETGLMMPGKSQPMEFTATDEQRRTARDAWYEGFCARSIAALSSPAPEADLYRHYKGGLYRKIGNAFHTETEEDLTLYVTVGAEDRVWARPTAMFNGTTPDCQRRFLPVNPSTPSSPAAGSEEKEHE